MAHGNFGGRRQRKQWSVFGPFRTLFTVNVTTLLGGLGGSPFTVLRMLGEYTIGATSTPVAADECVVSVGIIVVQDDAFVVGSTAMPDPQDDISPFLYWNSHPLKFVDANTNPSTPMAAVRHSFDVKSMRRLVAGETLALVGQYFDVNGAPPVSLSFGATRVLIGVS